MKKSHTKYIRLFMALLVVVGLYFLFLSTSESISYPETSFHDGKTYLDPVGKNEAEKNLAETQKLYDSYNASTSVYTRVGTLMRLYGYQESLWSYLEAKKTLETLISLQTSSNTLRTYALLLWKMGGPREAMEAIDHAIVLSPTLPDLWNTKIDFLRVLHKNNLKNLDSTYRNALKKTNNSIDIVSGYAHYLEQMGKKSESIEYYKKATEMNPQGKYEYQDAINRQQ